MPNKAYVNVDNDDILDIVGRGYNNPNNYDSYGSDYNSNGYYNNTNSNNNYSDKNIKNDDALANNPEVI